MLVFDRFLARVVEELDEGLTLKGGLALEFRLERARTTKDVDVRVLGPSDDILKTLHAAARRDLGDFMAFTIRPDDNHPEIRGDGVKYDGMRFKAECTIAGKIYGRPFGVDVAFGDPILGEPDRVVANDVLAFAGIAPPILGIYPVETHLAEKLHAFTMPRTRLNSRVKDLPDIALIATAGPLDADRLRAAIDQTFSFRGTHAIPQRLPDPPNEWEQPYAAIARKDQLQWATLDEVAAAAQSFLDPILADDDDARWDHESWSWIAPPS